MSWIEQKGNDVAFIPAHEVVYRQPLGMYSSFKVRVSNKKMKLFWTVGGVEKKYSQTSIWKEQLNGPARTVIVSLLSEGYSFYFREQERFFMKLLGKSNKRF